VQPPSAKGKEVTSEGKRPSAAGKTLHLTGIRVNEEATGKNPFQPHVYIPFLGYRGGKWRDITMRVKKTMLLDLGVK
jgi:hypothetical protein